MTGKPPRTRLSPDDRRAQLLRHAVVCFADHGIARATQAQVAALAGVSVSAVYFYFRTRTDLVSAVLDIVETRIAAMVMDAVAAPAPARQALTRLATRTSDLAVLEPDIVRVWLDWSTGVRAESWPRFLLLQERLCELVEGILRQAEEGRLASSTAATRSAARLFVGGAHTLALLRFENAQAADLALFIDQMVGGVVAVLARDG